MSYDTRVHNMHGIIETLSKPLDADVLETRKQAGQELTYVPWHKAVELLNEVAPDFEYRYVGTPFTYCTTKDGVPLERISVEVALTIAGVTRCARGEEELTGFSGYGDPISNASSMALRRAAAMFGLGLYLYDKGASKAPARPTNNAPRSMATAPATSAPSGAIVMTFGSNKGSTPAQLDDKNLRWYTNAYQTSVDDPAKAKFRDANQRILDALLADPRNGGGDEDLPQ